VRNSPTRSHIESVKRERTLRRRRTRRTMKRKKRRRRRKMISGKQ